MVNKMNIIEEYTGWIIPIFFIFILVYAYFKGVKIYDTFTKGAADGIKMGIKILPYLTAMMIAIYITRSSGLLKILTNSLMPLFKKLYIPEDIIPLLFLRPLSGSGSLAYVSTIMDRYGPDSFIGLLASTIQGSTETTFYIIAVYFGAIGIERYKYAILVGILSDIAGFFAAVFICNIMF